MKDLRITVSDNIYLALCELSSGRPEEVATRLVVNGVPDIYGDVDDLSCEIDQSDTATPQADKDPDAGYSDPADWWRREQEE